MWLHFRAREPSGRVRGADVNTLRLPSGGCECGIKIAVREETDRDMDFYINLKVNFRGNSKNFLLSGSETKSWESMEAMVRGVPSRGRIG